jgi:D-tyrosyl-tRNA(Tyr) deacylase
MRVVAQRVSSASVDVEAQDWHEKIGPGLLLLIGVEDGDGPDQVRSIARKFTNMRIFSDEEGKMNRSVLDIGGQILSVSQFTLYASIRKGNRPGFTQAGEPAHAKKVWQQLNDELHTAWGLDVRTGIFGADMQVGLVNDGPVTIIADTDELGV